MPAAAPVVQPVAQPEPEPSPTDFTDDQLRASGWSDAQIQELRGQDSTTTVTEAFSALGSQTVEVDIATGASLPAFNCIVTGNVLTASDAWWQCTGCGGFAAAVAIAEYTHCPACNLGR